MGGYRSAEMATNAFTFLIGAVLPLYGIVWLLLR
jgi:hypothetical protein